MARNIAILALLATVAIAAVVLSGTLSPPQTTDTFNLVIHVYDRDRGESPPNISQNSLIASVEVSVTGPRSFSAPTPTGILSRSDPLPSGTYQITAAKSGYTAIPLTYVLSSTCDYEDQFGICHAYVAMYVSSAS